MNIGDTFNLRAAFDQTEFKRLCAERNNIDSFICDLLEEWRRLRSVGGKTYERAGLRLDMARAERRRRKREEARAA